MKKFFAKVWKVLQDIGEARYQRRVRNGIRYY